MKEKKSFFGGLRRGKKQKETSDTAISEEKSEHNFPAEEENNSQIVVEKTALVTEDTSSKSDETIISDHTRPNETLGSLLADIQNMDKKTDVTEENIPINVPQDNDALSGNNESKEKKGGFRDIIAGIQKNKSERETTPKEPNAEDKGGITDSIPATDNEIIQEEFWDTEVSETLQEEQIEETAAEEAVEESLEQQTEEQISETLQEN